SGTQTVTSGTMSFSNVTISQTDDTLAVTGTMDVNGQLTITDAGVITTGTITVSGDIVTTDAAVTGSFAIVIDGAGAQSLSAGGGTGELPGVVINKAGGTLTIQDTINIDAVGWQYVAGTVDAGTSTVVLTDTATVASGAMSFNNVTINTNQTTDDITISGTMDINGDLTLTQLDNVLTGTLAVEGDVISTDPTVDGSGFLVFNGTGAQALSAGGGTGAIPSLTVNKSAGTLTINDTILIYSNNNASKKVVDYRQGTVDAGTSTLEFRDRGIIDSGSINFYDITFQAGGVDNFSVTGTMFVGNDLTLTTLGAVTSGEIGVSGDVVTTTTALSGSTIIVLEGSGAQSVNASGGSGALTSLRVDKPSGTLTISDSIEFIGNNADAQLIIDYVQGTVDLSSSLIVFRDRGVLNTGTMAFNDVEFNTSGVDGVDITGTLDINGNMTITEIGSGDLDGGVVTLAGNLTNTVDADVDGTTNFVFDGAGTQTVNGTTADPWTNGSFTINKTAGSVVLAANFVANESSEDLLVTSGTLDLAGFDVTVADQVDVDGGVRLYGNETVTSTALTFDTASSTVQFYNAGVTATITDYGQSFGTLI
ncbi:MAG: hypothetical protein K8I00_12420, partial [Candidatus Omnitrophica bacterium]|nr:hypothetical protein [Candidatus Omnitrophota bacterium]